MAQQAEPQVMAPELPPSRWQFLEGFPIRRVIQAVLLILIVVGVTYGTWKTLTLPKTSTRHFSGAAWRDLVVEGFALGSVYALIALGYTMVYGVLQLINFAHSEVFMVGTFAGLYTLKAIASGPEGGIVLAGLIGTAMRIVNAIPHVCAADPGMLSTLDLPLFGAKHLMPQ